MKSSIDGPVDADFTGRRTLGLRTVLRAVMNRLAFAVAVLVATSIFAAICAGAALAAVFLSVS